MRGMNGSTGASSDNRGYTGGLPPQGLGPGSLVGLGMGIGTGPQAPPGMGLPPGSVGAAAAAAAAAGFGSPEFKNHADFLSRLLAATPSYMNEVGNPPPGFFSDWLRRLVSKPSGNSGSLQTSGLTFPGGGQPETESSGGRPSTGGSCVGSGGAGVPSTTPNSSLDAQISSKRRKRSRLNDHPEHPLGNDRDTERPGSRSSGGGGNGNNNNPIQPPVSLSNSGLCSTTSMPNSASSPPSAAALAAAAALQPLGAYPFWFFPPFMANPYGMGMNMGMNFPGHPGHPSGNPGGPGGLSAAAQAAALSSYLGSSPSSDLFRTDNLNLFSGSITASSGRGTGSSGGSVGGNMTSSATSPHSLSHPFQHPPPHSIESANHHHHHLSHSGLSHPHLSKMSSVNRQHEGKGKESPPVTSRKDSPSSYLSAAAAAASASFLMGTSGGSVTSGLHSKISNQTPSPSSHHYPNTGGNHNGVHNKLTAKSPPSSHHPSGSTSTTSKTNNSKSFSISRLTSPSPSSSNSSSGGSITGRDSRYHATTGGHHHKQHRNSNSSNTSTNPYDHQDLRSLQHQYSSSYNSSENNSVLKSNLTAKSPKENKERESSVGGSKGPSASSYNIGGDSGGLGVDLRVSGRMWENSSGPPARSLYTPLSAFRDPSDSGSGTRTSPQGMVKYDPHHHSKATVGGLSESSRGNSPPHGLQSLQPMPPIPEQLSHHSKQSLAALSSTFSSKTTSIRSLNPLSTGNVFRSIQHIYQQIRPVHGSSTTFGRSTPSTISPSCNTTTTTSVTANSPNPNQITSHPINNHHSPPSTTAKNQNYQQSTINHHHPGNSDNKNSNSNTSSGSTTNNSNINSSPINNNNSSSNALVVGSKISITDSENDDIPNDSRSHSSSSSILDDDDFKPEAELLLQTVIKENDDTLNLTSLNNNNIDKKELLPKDKESKSKKSKKNKGESKKRKQKNETKLPLPISPGSTDEPARVLKRRFSMSCENELIGNEEPDDGFDEQIQNPYKFVETLENKQEGRTSKKKSKKDNNNESVISDRDEDKDEDASLNSRFRVSVPEKHDDDYDSSNSLNLLVENDGGGFEN